MIRGRVKKMEDMWIFDVYEMDEPVMDTPMLRRYVYMHRKSIVHGSCSTWNRALTSACAWIQKESERRG